MVVHLYFNWPKVDNHIENLTIGVGSKYVQTSILVNNMKAFVLHVTCIWTCK